MFLFPFQHPLVVLTTLRLGFSIGFTFIKADSYKEVTNGLITQNLMTSIFL